MNSTTSSIDIRADIDKIWTLITNPYKLKVSTPGPSGKLWDVGGIIFFGGTWNEKTFVDKGEITKLVPNKAFEYKLWQDTMNIPQTDQNYSIIRFKFEEKSECVTLTITEEKTTESESVQDWEGVLKAVKESLELAK